MSNNVIEVGNEMRYNVFMNKEEFKALREGLGLSQQEFGVALGFGDSGANVRVSEIERGDSPISRHVEIICRYMARFGPLGDQKKREKLIRKFSGLR